MAFLFGASSKRARLLVLAAALVLTTLYLGFRIRQDASEFSGGLAGAGTHAMDIGGDADESEALAAVSKPDATTPAPAAAPTCLKFEELQRQRPGPASAGKRKFPLVRPPPGCRTYNLSSLEALLVRMKTVIKDPDLYRLFENSYPNTLDTMIKWRGFARQPASKQASGWGDNHAELGPETDEELTYVITGDIDAMWLRDSASQIYSYLPLLEADEDHDSLAGLWRGLINLQARYITISPYCHSFQPPPESGIKPTTNGAYHQNNPQPPYDPVLVFDCKWELDSLASFLRVSAAYAQRTGDLSFFGKYKWQAAVRAAVDASAAMQLGTYADDGKKISDDVPSVATTPITLANDAVVPHRDFGDIIAYEVDGFGGANLMDDANVPSLLSIPLFFNASSAGAKSSSSSSSPFRAQPRGEKKEQGTTDGSKQKQRDYGEIYRNTRKFVLSDANPYFAKGPVISAVGGPHLGPGKAWPMAALVAGLTAYEPLSGGDNLTAKEVRDEVAEQLRMVLDSTAGSGVVHESVNSWEENNWTRSWFGWANGLFGELVLRIEEQEKGDADGLLSRSWQ
ncbi:hypothetical protein MAPG_03161 [Magnaporthiopsis poae ATCC 64411]|uniref:DUF1237 domain-containing protein n=1 Tax=Magnaporthiopsis poae (strain ATCC 64411 / 73-15) TaxID=644358 RepID=A0A0C4DTA1_MAGP6|nr:hypothetical protein MAPG_03161 [Magnaporthiopsis poae ATCC 64411]